MLNYAINIATASLALFYLAKDWPAHKESWRRLSVLGLICLIGIGGVFNTYYTKKSNNEKHQEDLNRIARLESAVVTANRNQDDNTKQFVNAFGILNQKVADLETQIKTTGLKEEAIKLRAELESTQKALNPPKAKLTFTFPKPNIDDPAVKVVSLPVKNGVVNVDFCVKNTTDVDAHNGSIMLTICKACEFASEPIGFFSFPGLPKIQRNIKFDRISAISESQNFSVAIKVPQKSSKVEIGITYRCENCILPEPRAEVGIIELIRE